MRAASRAIAPAAPKVFCICAFLPPMGSSQYTRLVSHFQVERDIWVVSHSGYRQGERLTEKADMVPLYAKTILEHAAGAPYVLMGISIGGFVAHRIAEYLQGTDQEPAGVVLLDTQLPKDMDAGFSRAVAKPMLSIVSSYGAGSDDAMIAMQWYPEAVGLKEHQPAQLRMPTLYVRALEPVDGLSKVANAQATHETKWYSPYTIVDVPGDHFTMLQNVETPRAIEAWLGALPVSEPSRKESRASGVTTVESK
jgi:thioesterase domain-containing protein